MSLGELLRQRLRSWRQGVAPEKTSEPSLASYLGYANNLIALPATGASHPLPPQDNIRDAEIVGFETTSPAREAISARLTFKSELEAEPAPKETSPLPQTSITEVPVPIDALKDRIRLAFTHINGTVAPSAPPPRAATHQFHAPASCFHWILEPRLAVVTQPDIFFALYPDQASLAQAGFANLITIQPPQAEEQPPVSSDGFHIRLTHNEPPSIEQIDAAVELIDNCLDAETRVLLHWRNGLEHAALLLAALLMLKRGLPTKAALRELSEYLQAPASPEDHEDILLEYEVLYEQKRLRKRAAKLLR
ncbi:MAG: hypothetical protein PHU07_01335 [Acidocella sp.]|nr:hypothetical protein [Acidocella sp.]